MGLDTSCLNLVSCNYRADFEDSVPHTILMGFDSALRDYGLAGGGSHKTDLVKRTLARDSLDTRRRRRLHGRSGIFRCASSALQPLHMASVCYRRNYVSLFRGAVVLKQVISDE